MSILTRILGLGSKADARADQQRSHFIAPSRFAAHLGLGTKAGVSVSEEGAMALSAVYSCVRLIGSSLASIDLHLVQVNQLPLSSIEGYAASITKTQEP